MTEESTESAWGELETAILSLLPDEGTKLGKYLLQTKTAAQILRELGDPHLTSHNIGRRLSTLHKRGLVVRVVGTGGGGDKNTWQRTKEGAKVAREANGNSRGAD